MGEDQVALVPFNNVKNVPNWGTTAWQTVLRKFNLKPAISQKHHPRYSFHRKRHVQPKMNRNCSRRFKQ
eukprot:5951418-Pyramimonas_sp.AAC.1